MDNDCYFRGAIWPADKWNRRPLASVGPSQGPAKSSEPERELNRELKLEVGVEELPNHPGYQSALNILVDGEVKDHVLVDSDLADEIAFRINYFNRGVTDGI